MKRNDQNYTNLILLRIALKIAVNNSTDMSDFISNKFPKYNLLNIDFVYICKIRVSIHCSSNNSYILGT